jgi:diguanylate cyclase (GGDEF)-like protein
MSGRRTNSGRRANDRTTARKRFDFPLLASPACLRAVTWEEQRSQFITRYLFWVLGMLYFNLGTGVARSAEFLTAVNVLFSSYLVLTTLYMWNARRHRISPLRWRLAMWTDLVNAAFAALADASFASPAYAVFLVIILGNGMRYGIRPFGEAALGSFLLVVLVQFLRVEEALSTLSVASIFFLLFGGIVVLYAYSLMARIERWRVAMAQQSGLDPLTGLLNRRGLEERATLLLSDVKENGPTLSMLFVDLDRFKAVNDLRGHHVGDAVLRKVAGLINASIRESDVAARYGGDEFVILMPATTRVQARQVGERLQAAMAGWTRQTDVQTTLSIGLGEAPVHGRTLDELLRRVDRAMYLNKQHDRRGGIRDADEVPG